MALSPTTTASERSVNDPRETFGWMMYDWANSTFPTTVLSALLGPYLTVLAQRVLGDNGAVPYLTRWVTAKSLFPFCVGLSVFLQVFLLPVLGAIADYSSLKKRLMAVFCYAGVAATCLLFFVTGELYLLGGVLLIVGNIAFGASIVLYNAFLPEICTEDMRDRVSSRGYALGYLGGGILLALNFALVSLRERLGLSLGMAVRLSLLSAGVWWGGFAVLTFARLKVRQAPRALPPGASYLGVGVAELKGTFRELRRLPHTLHFLIGYLLYNDGIQTVIAMAAVVVEQELFIRRGLGPQPQFLLELLLMIQIFAFFGSLLFERVAGAVGAKRAILLSLVGWSGVVIYAYRFLHTVAETWVLGAVIALVLGGSQALSRSLFSLMIPAGREASFFGIYEISERGTSWIGPAIFGLVVAATNDYREAMLSLIVLFLGGMIVLATTDTRQAILDAGNTLPEDAVRR